MRRTVLLVLLVAGGVRGGLAQPAPFQVVEATIDDVRSALTSRRITCRALVEQYLRRIDAYDKSGPALNAVQTVNASALGDAERLDAQFASSGPVGPLHCIPMLVKDQVETRGMPTMYGSVIFKDFVSARDATVVDRLRKAGAVIVGKATMGEFASGYVGSAFGVVRNAYDPTRIAERVVRRHRRGRRRELRDRRHRRGHRRLDPRSRGRAQPGRVAADASARQPLRHDASPADHRHARPHRALCERCRARARRDRWLRCQRSGDGRGRWTGARDLYQVPHARRIEGRAHRRRARSVGSEGRPHVGRFQAGASGHRPRHR